MAAGGKFFDYPEFVPAQKTDENYLSEQELESMASSSSSRGTSTPPPAAPPPASTGGMMGGMGMMGMGMGMGMMGGGGGGTGGSSSYSSKIALCQRIWGNSFKQDLKAGRHTDLFTKSSYKAAWNKLVDMSYRDIDREMKALFKKFDEDVQKNIQSLGSYNNTQDDHTFKTNSYGKLGDLSFSWSMKMVDFFYFSRKCAAFHALLHYDPDVVGGQVKTSQGAMLMMMSGGMGGGMGGMGGMGGGASGGMGGMNSMMQMMMMSGGMKCISHAETQSYGKCESLISTMDRFILVEMGVDQGTNLYMQDGQIKADLSAQKANHEDPTVYLENLKSQVQRQSHAAMAKAGAKLAKAGSLQAVIRSYPSRKTLVNYCTGKVAKYDEAEKELEIALEKIDQVEKAYFNAIANYYTNLKNAIRTNTSTNIQPMQSVNPPSTSTTRLQASQRENTIESSWNAASVNSPSASELDENFQNYINISTIQLCDESMDEVGEDVFLPSENKQVKNIANMISMQSGIEGATQAAAGGMLLSQANKIDDTIDDLKKKTSKEKSAALGKKKDEKVELCKEFPNDPKCTSEELKELALKEQTFSVGGGFGNTSIGSSGSDENGKNSAAGNSKNNSGKLGDYSSGVGSNYVDKGEGDIEGQTGMGASVKGGGVGGGGGGGAGAGGVGSPGIGDAPGSDKAPPPNNAPGSSEVLYKGGGGAGVTYGGANNGNQNNTPDNPYKDFFDQNKKQGPQDPNVLNYQGAGKDIGSAKNQIFQMVEKAMQRANSQGRLLEYVAE